MKQTIKAFYLTQDTSVVEARSHCHCGIILVFELQQRKMAKCDADGLERRPERPEGVLPLSKESSRSSTKSRRAIQ